MYAALSSIVIEDNRISPNLRRDILRQIGALMMSAIAGFASDGSNAKVWHSIATERIRAQTEQQTYAIPMARNLCFRRS